MTSYEQFLQSKTPQVQRAGFEPRPIESKLFGADAMPRSRNQGDEQTGALDGAGAGMTGMIQEEIMSKKMLIRRCQGIAERQAHLRCKATDEAVLAISNDLSEPARTLELLIAKDTAEEENRKVMLRQVADWEESVRLNPPKRIF